MKLESILIVDPDTDYTATLRRDPAFTQINPQVAASGGEAKAALAQPQSRFRAIIVSAAVVAPGAIHLIRLAHERHPATPVFLLYDGEAPLSPQETLRLALRGCIARPPTLAELWSHATSDLGPKAAAPAGPLPGDTAVVLEDNNQATTAPTPDAEFRSVWIEEFLNGYPSFYDVYIRVPSGRYLKILNAKDTLDPARAQHYMNLGVERLYIRRASHDRLLSYCDLLASALIRRPTGISVELKFGELASTGAELAALIQKISSELGEKAELSDVHLDYAFTYLADLFSLVKQLEKQPGPLVRSFVRSGALMESGIATSIIVGLMALPLGLSSSRAFTQLGLAALLHDIGLLILPKHIRETPPELLRENELRVYETHPELGANALRPFSRRIGPVTLQAVAQHHERRDGSGFPKRTGASEIHLFAEAIGLADEFLGLLRQRRTNPNLDVSATLELRVFRTFSPKVVEAFRAVFLKGGR